MPLIDLTFGAKYEDAASWLGPLSVAMSLYALSTVYLYHFLSLGRSRFALVLAGMLAIQLVIFAFVHGSPRELIGVQIGVSAFDAASRAKRGTCGGTGSRGPALQSAAWRRPRTAEGGRDRNVAPRALFGRRRSGRTSCSRRSRASRSSRSTRRTRSTSTTSRDLGFPGEFPFTRGVYPSMYRGRLWTMRQFAGLRHGGGDERALPLPARARPDGPLDGVRHADADGLRLGPPALAGRGRPRGRRDRLARRHGDAVRRHPARRGVDVDDDQLAGGDPARVLRLRRRGAGRGARRSCAGRCRRTSSRSTSRRRSSSSRPSRRCGWSST